MTASQRKTIKLVIAYDGTDYCGWQKQDNGPTIQEEIEQVASVICNEPITVYGAGRTDAGVHALGMTAHFKTISAIDLPRLQQGLNSMLPPAIRILDLQNVADDFHARFSAVSKTYRYSVFNGDIMLPEDRLYRFHYPYKLAEAPMKACLKQIVGTHDFSSFENSGTRDKSIQSGKGAVRTIFSAKLEQHAANCFDMHFTGDGFLRQMVRNLSGSILEVGRGLRTAREFQAILKQKDRQAAGVSAPPCGLTLIKVDYQ
ncbi:MAG: tRNA pseudouridine(38-40) synthase TruA [Desulfobulbaceae bacterium]|nr:MAG: tRNA pseudouridine(38-40) synthase TruA [Desulfobulbaceae bacterium]